MNAFLNEEQVLQLINKIRGNNQRIGLEPLRIAGKNPSIARC